MQNPQSHYHHQQQQLPGIARQTQGTTEDSTQEENNPTSPQSSPLTY
jgi:hypothetical protein